MNDMLYVFKNGYIGHDLLNSICKVLNTKIVIERPYPKEFIDIVNNPQMIYEIVNGSTKLSGHYKTEAAGWIDHELTGVRKWVNWWVFSRHVHSGTAYLYSTACDNTEKTMYRD
jgi:hypothetical protein